MVLRTSGLALKGTAAMLIGCGAILLYMEFMGNQIECRSGLTREFTNSACLRQFYTLGTRVDSHVDSHEPSGFGMSSDNYTKLYYPNYRWIWLYLTLLGFLVLIPLYFGDKETLKMLMMGIPKHCQDEEKIIQRREHVVNYITGFGKRRADFYLFKHCFARILVPLVLVGVAIFFHHRSTENFVQQEGLELELHGDADADDNPQFVAETEFPVVALCDVYIYGPVGNRILYQAQCALGQNEFNQKAFPVICNWLVICSAFTILTTLVHFLFILHPKIRLALIRFKTGEPVEKVECLKFLTTGQMLVLSHLSGVMNDLEFSRIIRRLQSF